MPLLGAAILCWSRRLVKMKKFASGCNALQLSRNLNAGCEIQPPLLCGAMTFNREFPQGQSFPMRQQQSERHHRSKRHQPQQNSATRG